MAEEQGNVVSENLRANGEDNLPQIGMLNQYVKDLSVENPNAPASFTWEGAPRIDLQVQIGATPVGEEVHEVTIKLTARAETDEGVQFSVELDYSTLFGIRNVSDDEAHPFLYGEAPRLMFPFARRIIADAVRDAGFTPLMLEPIDFNSLYLQQRAQAQAMAEGEPAGEA